MAEIDPWSDDLLNRRDDGEHLKALLINRYEQRKERGQGGSYILNVDAGWGEGKSFFISRLMKSCSMDGHPTALINAWTDDVTDDPLTTVLAAITKALEGRFPAESPAEEVFKSAKRKLAMAGLEIGKQVGAFALRKGIGVSIEQVAAAWSKGGLSVETADELSGALTEGISKEGDKLIDAQIASLQLAEQSLASFRTQTGNALASLDSEDSVLPMFVFVDELDRCRPTYAIRLLEELRHIFAIDGIVFIIATDGAQLAHAVRAVYGEGFDGRAYLRRFFDRVFVFPTVKADALISHALEQTGIDPNSFYQPSGYGFTQVLASWKAAFNLSNRDFEQCFEIIQTFVTSWRYTAKIEPMFLLALVVTAFRGDWGVFNQLSALQNLTTLEPYFSGWSLREGIHNRSTDRMEFRNVDALSYIRNNKLLTGLTLLDVLNQSGDAYWNWIARDEFSAIHNQSLTYGDSAKSVLLEYPSRVRNAGRVLAYD